MTDREVSPERSGWRDMALSQKHREWGWNCPAIDIDLLFLEYDKGQPVALVEYKHENAAPQKASHPSYQAIINLGNRAELPVFACRYADDFSWWKVVPLNKQAKTQLPSSETMNEKEWVSFLYRLRGYDPPEQLFNDANIQI